jgi:hypothetical protein
VGGNSSSVLVIWPQTGEESNQKSAVSILKEQCAIWNGALKWVPTDQAAPRHVRWDPLPFTDYQALDLVRLEDRCQAAEETPHEQKREHTTWSKDQGEWREGMASGAWIQDQSGWWSRVQEEPRECAMSSTWADWGQGWEAEASTVPLSYI